MEFKNAKYINDCTDSTKDPYITIYAVVDGRHLSIPCVVGNRYYDQAMKQVKEGTLTIEDAD